MTAPLAPSHGRGASSQVGELEFPSPPHFHLSFRAQRTAQPLGTDTADTSQDNLRLLVRPHGLGTQRRARSSLNLAHGEREEPNQAPGAVPGAHTHELPAPQHNPQGAQTPRVCFADGKVLTNVQSRDARWRRVLCKYNIIYWFHFRARVVFVRVS